MATKKQEMEAMAGGRGVLGKAADDEPLFILRGQDMLAPAAIEYWANLLSGIMGLDAKDKVEDARLAARKMRNWQRENGHRLPD